MAESKTLATVGLSRSSTASVLRDSESDILTMTPLSAKQMCLGRDSMMKSGWSIVVNPAKHGTYFECA